MNFDKELHEKELIEISKLAECEVSEIQVFAIPDTLAISFLISTRKEAKEMYIQYAAEKGKRIQNPASWDEFQGYNNRLILLPNGYGVCDTPFHPKNEKSEFDIIRDIFKDNKNVEVKSWGHK